MKNYLKLIIDSIFCAFKNQVNQYDCFSPQLVLILENNKKLMILFKIKFLILYRSLIVSLTNENLYFFLELIGYEINILLNFMAFDNTIFLEREISFKVLVVKMRSRTHF